MLEIHQLTYNPFSENTYLISAPNGETIIVDPGMYDHNERERFKSYLDIKGLKPVRLLLTHAHLDHIFGLKWVNETYDLSPELHSNEKPIYESAQLTAQQYGLSMDTLPMANYVLQDIEQFQFNGSDIKLLFTPGHSPGSVSFVLPTEQLILGGDVLFQGSIGRTDLPGGDYDTLIQSIKSQLLPIGDDYLVYSGHGPVTNIGQEKISNYYLNLS